MTVAIQNGLENLASALRDYGFDVVEYSSYPYPIDALIYKSTNIVQKMNVSSENHAHRGIFMINAHGKSADEIVDILNRRTYTPLF